MAISPGMLSHTVVIVTPGTIDDDWGNPRPNWAAGTTRRTSRAYVSQRTSTEDTAHRDTIVSTYRLYLPANVPIGAHDRVEWEGATYEVDGKPHRAIALAGPDHWTADLRKVEG